MFIGLPFKFEGAPDGRPIKIHDVASFIDSIPSNKVFAKTTPETRDQVVGLFKSMDEETLAAMMIKVPAFMSICQGNELTLGLTDVSQVSQPSPFGEGTIKTNATLELTSLNKKQGIASIAYTSEFDPDSMNEIIQQFFGKLSSDAPPTDTELADMTISRQDTANCNVDISTGWVQNMTYTTEMTINNQIQSESYDVKLDWAHN